MLTDVAQRWREHRGVYRPAGEVIVPSHYEVAEIPDDTTPRAFIHEHHYSHTFPSARFRFGLYRGGALVGVAVFSTPMQDKVLDVLPVGAEVRAAGPWMCRSRFGSEVTNNRIFIPGEKRDRTELGRLVLLDDVPGNGESWFVTRCFEALLREHGITGVLSFSDPTPRTDASGRVIFLGHVGNVYQAMSAIYAGRSTPRTLRLLPDGTVLSDRAMSKVRQQEQGHAAVEKILVRAGAKPLGRREEPAVWLRKWLQRLTTTSRHPGNFRYLFGLTPAVKRHLPPSMPYPKFTL